MKKDRTMAEEIRYRIDSVRAATNEGYGHKPSLCNYVDAGHARIEYLTPVIKDIKSLPIEEVGKELIEEYDTLLKLCEEAKVVIDDPNILGVDICGKEWWENHFDGDYPWDSVTQEENTK